MKYKEPQNKAYKLSPFWISAIATALGRQHKVKIQRGDKWAMDMKNKILQYTDDICFLDKDNVLALLLHEIGHLRFSEWYDESTVIYKEAPEAAQNCINACEDIRIDDVMSRMYEGSYGLITALHTQSVNEGLTKLMKHKEGTEQMKQYLEEATKQLEDAQLQIKSGRVSTAEYERFAEQIREQEPKITGRINPVAECMYVMLTLLYGFDDLQIIKEYEQKNPIIIEKARLCIEEVKKHSIEYMETTGEIQVFYEQYIYPIIKDLIEKNQDGSEKKFEKQARTKSSQSVDLSGGKGEGEPSDGDGDSEGKGKNGRQPTQDQQNEMASRAQARMSGRADNTAKSLAQGSKPSHNTPNSGQVDYNDFYETVQDYVNASSSKFNRILKDNKFDRYSGRYRTGELNQRKLYKYKTRDYKLFQRKTERQNKDYAFSVMMDVSGSMSGQRATESMKGVVLMCEVLNRCGVPYEVAFFSSGYGVGKTFDSPLSRLKVGQEASKIWGGGTDIFVPFKKMVGNLGARKERHKVMVVLSDGDVGGDEERQSINLMKKNPGITYYGIGIQCNLEAMFRENSITVKDVTEIMPRFASILKKHIKIG